MTIEQRRESALHPILETLCNNVYFQPPANVHMAFPAIIYSRDDSDVKYANDNSYLIRTRYSIMYISTNPDDTLFEDLYGQFKHIRYDRHYTKDNLHHNVYTLYF